MDFWVQPSLKDNNVYFVFRYNGDEIRVEIVKGLLRPSKKLTADESNYLIENLVDSLDKTQKNEIIRDHLKGDSDRLISEKLNVSTRTVARAVKEYWENKKTA